MKTAPGIKHTVYPDKPLPINKWFEYIDKQNLKIKGIKPKN